MNPNFAITSLELLLAVGIGFVLFLILIAAGRYHFSRESRANLAERHQGEPRGTMLLARNKYPEVNVFLYSKLLWRFSLVIVLALIIGAFNWTVYDKGVYIPDDALTLDHDIEIEVPRSAEPPPPPPPPPPPTFEAVADMELLDEDPIEFVDQSVDAGTYIEAPVYQETKREAPPPPPPPPPPPAHNIEEIFKVVEEMPRFPGCENMVATTEEKRMCSNRKMLEFIYENIRYPAVARDNGIEGTVVVSFVVNENGYIYDAQVVRDIGGGCGAEALRVVNMMNDLPLRWAPGKQRGRAVKVLFNLPVRFKLEVN